MELDKIAKSHTSEKEEIDRDINSGNNGNSCRNEHTMTELNGTARKVINNASKIHF